MHIETLKTFCDLIETGSFSQAARINYVTQSAVSQQVRVLEERFELPLLERHRKGVVPTEAGRLLYAECKEIVERFDSLKTRMQTTNELAGTVRVATVYSVGLHELPPYVKQFMKAHPQVKVHIEYSRTDKIYEACQNNTIDFGIVALPLKRANMAVIPLRNEKLVMVCAPEHKLARKRKVSLQQLNGEDFIAFERDIPTRKTIDRLLKEHRVTVTTVMEFDNIETIKRSVEVGTGLSILPETTIVNEVRNGSLMALDFSEGTFTRTVGVIHRKGKVLNPAIRAFIQMLKALSEEPPSVR